MKKIFIKLIGLLIVVTLLVSNIPMAITTVFADSSSATLTLDGYKDETVLEGVGSIAYVGAYSYSTYQTAALTFNIPDVAGTITNATLRIYVSEINGEDGIPEVSLLKSSDTWSEVGAELPSYVSTNYVTYNNGNFSHSNIPITAIGWLSFDVTDYLIEEYNGDKIITFVLTGIEGAETWSEFGFYTRENGSNIPELTITTASYAPALANGLSFSDAAGAANNGKTTIALGAPSVAGNTFRYLVSSDANAVPAPILGFDASSWTSVTNGDMISVVNGKHIGVAEVDSTGKVVQFSDATAVVVDETADLINLTVSGSPANYTFAGGTYTYNGVTVANEISSITITPNGAGTITVDGVNVASEAASNAIALTPGVEKTITVIATEAGKTPKTYTIKVTRAVETIPPTIIGAVRNSDTQIIVELSEPSKDLAKENDGGFVVHEIGNTETTYTVNQTAQGADNSHVVLTVANMGVSAKEGITVKYTAGGNGTIEDLAGNALATDGIGVNIEGWDTTAPAVSSIVRQNPAAASTNATTVIYRITFSEAVTGVDKNDFTLTATGTAAGVIASVSASSGTSIDVAVYAITGVGTLRLDLNNSGTGIQDIGGNAIATGYTTGEAYTVDTTAPAVSSIVRQNPAAASTNATTVIYRITFSEAVTGVDISDFTLTETGTAAGVIASVSASSGASIDVTVNTITGVGTLRLDLNNSGTGIADISGNVIASGYATGEIYTVDAIAPVVSSIIRQNPAAASTNATAVIYRITFSEAVTGVDISDFTLTSTGTATGVIASVSASSGTSIDVAVNTITGVGTLRLDLNNSGTGIADISGNVIATGYTTGETYTVDTTAPAVSSIVRQNPAAASTNATAVIYRITFSEAVTGVDISDFTLTSTGTAAGVIASVSASSGTSIDVTVNTITGAGTLRLDLNNSGTGIADIGGTAIATGYTVGEAYTVDTTAPAVSSIVRQNPAAASTNATAVIYRITFSEAVTGVDISDFTLTATGTAAGAIASILGSGATIDVTVNTITGTGTLRLDLNDSGTGIEDIIGNAITSGYTAGEAYTLDHTAPTLTAGSANRTGSSTATVKFTSSESGVYYYIVVGDDDPIPVIDTLGAGVPCTTSETTINLTGIDNVNKDVYVCVKDEAGNISAAIKLDLGTYTAPPPVVVPPPVVTPTPEPTPEPTPTPTPEPEEQGEHIEAILNGSIGVTGTLITEQSGDNTTTTVVVDQENLLENLENQNNTHNTIVIPVQSDSETNVIQLTGLSVDALEARNSVIEVRTTDVIYTIAAAQININDVVKELGAGAELKDISVNIKIAQSASQTIKIVEDSADKNNYKVVIPPLDFEITCISGDKSIEVNKFNHYVERIVAIPDGIDPSKITTGVVFNSDGSFSHVPTTIVVIEGKYYAKINSLTNSTYSVIWNPKEFADVEGHWAKDAINDLGSRLVIDGMDEENFSPDTDITRAQFAAIVVRALGVMRPNVGKDTFRDVTSDVWYYDAVSIACEYGIIKGYEDGTFRPDNNISREEAMVMVSRAMNIVGLDTNITQWKQDFLLGKFKDGNQVAGWARDAIAACVQNDIASGYNNNILAKSNITRAETAVLIRRMLIKSELI